MLSEFNWKTIGWRWRFHAHLGSQSCQMVSAAHTVDVENWTFFFSNSVIVQWHDSNLWLMALTSFSLENSQFLSCEDRITLSCLDMTKFSTTMSKLRQYDASEVTTSNLTWKIQILYGYVLTSKNEYLTILFYILLTNLFFIIAFLFLLWGQKQNSILSR